MNPRRLHFDPDSNRPGSGSRSKSRRYKDRVRAQSLANISLSWPTSDQDDVVLLLRVHRLDLQRNGLADEVTQLREALRFLVQEHVDHRLRRQDAEFARIELLGLAHDLAQDVVADRLRRLELAAPVARRA